MGGSQYKNMMDMFQTLPGVSYWNEKYTWLVPKEHIDTIIGTIGEDNIAWFNSYEEIKEIKSNVIPKFEVSEEALEDLKLPPYPFQAVGVSFLHDIKYGLLADEMGLGSWHKLTEWLR